MPPVDSATVNGEDYIWLTLPRLLAFALNWWLLGALTVQLYFYYVSFQDRLGFKIMVYGLYLADVAQTCSTTYDAAQWFGHRWGDPSALENLYTSFLNVPLLTGLIGATVQIFYGWRIWSISKSNMLYGLIISMALTQLAASIAIAYLIFHPPHDGEASPILSIIVGMRLGTSAIVDILIAGCMVYFLVRDRSMFTNRTNTVVTKLARLTIETGAITTIAAVLDLGFFLTLQQNTLYQLCAVNLSKLYTSCFLMLLNNRVQIRKSYPVGTDVSFVDRSWLRRGEPDETTGSNSQRSLDGDGDTVSRFQLTRK